MSEFSGDNKSKSCLDHISTRHAPAQHLIGAPATVMRSPVGTYTISYYYSFLAAPTVVQTGNIVHIDRERRRRSTATTAPSVPLPIWSDDSWKRVSFATKLPIAIPSCYCFKSLTLIF